MRALSELGRAWMAGTVDAVGDDLLARRGLAQSAAPPLVVAGDSGSSWGELVIRRATQLAWADDAQLLVVHVQIADGLTHPRGLNLHRHRELTAELGGSYTEMTASNPAQALAGIARGRGAATVVVGHHRSRLGELGHGSVASRLRRLLPEIVIEEVRRT